MVLRELTALQGLELSQHNQVKLLLGLFKIFGKVNCQSVQSCVWKEPVNQQQHQQQGRRHSGDRHACCKLHNPHKTKPADLLLLPLPLPQQLYVFAPAAQQGLFQLL